MTLNSAHISTDSLPLSNAPGSASRITFWGIFLFAALKPFYIWGSGLPQVADLILVLTIAHTIIAGQNRVLPGRHTDISGMLAVAFALYATLINLLAALVSEWDPQFIFSSLFILYNVAIYSWFASQVRQNAHFTLHALTLGTLLSLFVQVPITALSEGFGFGRAIGTFNNPNQLGYYTVLAVCILIISARPLPKLRIFIIAGVLCGIMLALASLSKAAIGAMGLLIIGYCIVGLPGQSRRFHLGKRTFATLALLGLTYIVSRTEWLLDLDIARSVTDRFQTIESDDSLDARGYDRLTDFPQYLAFGAGEGAYSRFGSSIEFHSLPGNLLLSYGIIGASLFAALMITAVLRSGPAGFFIISAIAFYGITHNGLRMTLLWVLLAALAALKDTPKCGTKDHNADRQRVRNR